MSTQTPNGLDPFEGPFEWTDLDQRAVDTARAAGRRRRAEGRQRPPGTAVSLAPGRVTLFQKVMRTTRPTPTGIGRDRFRPVARPLSPSPSTPSSSWLGYEPGAGRPEGVPHAGLKTPGHGYSHTAGVGTTTGPLGPGVANAVGMAMAARYERGLFDPEAPGDASPFDHYRVRDRLRRRPAGGRLRRGQLLDRRAPEARQPRPRSATTATSPSRATPRPRFSEGRPRSATRRTAGTCSAHRAAGRRQRRRTEALYSAIAAAKKPRPGARPSSRCARSSPGPRRPPRTPGVARLGARRRRDRRHQARRSASTPSSPSIVGDDVISHTRKALDRGAQAHEAGWDKHARRLAHRQRSALPSCSTGSYAGRLPAGWERALPAFETGTSVATRAASGKVLQALGAVILPSCGAAPPTSPGSNSTTIDKNSSFLPKGSPLPGRPTAAPSTSASASSRWPPR